MRKNEIRVGGLYLAKISNNIVTVRVDSIREAEPTQFKRAETVYGVTNLKTGRKVTFRSAAKFRAEVKPQEPKATTPKVKRACILDCGRFLIGGPEGWVCPDCATAKAEFLARVQENMETSEPAEESTDEALEAAVAKHDAQEDEQRPDPTPRRTATAVATAASATSATTPNCGAESPRNNGKPAGPVGKTTTPPAPIASAVASATDPLLADLAAQLAVSRQGRQRGTPVAGMVPNDEQEEILDVSAAIDEAADLGRVVVIGAGAGTGKTATLKMLEQILTGNGQYTAFNKSLVEESRTKFKKAAVNSTHSLAFRAIGKRYAHRLPPHGAKMRSRQIATHLRIEAIQLVIAGETDSNGTPRVKTLSAEFLAGQVMVCIRQFRMTADRQIETRHFRYIDGIDGLIDSTNEDGEPIRRRSRENNDKVREYLLPFARAAWADLTDPDGVLPFSHDDYVKMWQLGTGNDRPIIAADYILLDEAQDTAPVFLDILQQQKHALLVLVGDDNQQIYEWRGAVNAMAAFPGAPRRLLSQSYRFGQIIADVANAVLRTLVVPTDLVMRGNPAVLSRVAKVAEPRCFLYRTNAGAIGRLMKALEEGKRPHLIGGGSDVVSWCEAALDLQATPPRPTSHYELACFTDWDEVKKYSKSDEGEDMRLMVKLIDEFGAAKIRDALKGMPKEENADLIISTAHKSKGREWDTVRLGPDFPLANKMGDSDRRLLYVAATRAKLTLDISECPPFCGGHDKRDTGNAETSGAWVPGLKIDYTVPMPSEAEQEAAQSKKAETSSTPALKEAPQPAAAPLQSWKQDGKWIDAVEFTFCKPAFANGGFALRGPHGHKPGEVVNVKTRAGGTKPTKIKAILREFPDATVYSIDE